MHSITMMINGLLSMQANLQTYKNYLSEYMQINMQNIYNKQQPLWQWEAKAKSTS